MEVNANSAVEAENLVKDACEKLLINPVMEAFEINQLILRLNSLGF